MTRRLTIVGSAAMGLLLVGVARAGEKPSAGPMGNPRGESDQTVTMEQDPSHAKTSSKNLRTVRMTIQDVDAATHTVVVEIHVSPEANITETGRPIKLDQLKSGDQIVAAVDPVSGDVMKLTVTQKGTGAREGTGAH